MLSVEQLTSLGEQIESLSPSAAVLESKGVDLETAATLARFIKTGAPDVTTLKEHGLSLSQSVEICDAIVKRHARRAAALANVPKVTAPKPAKPVEPAVDGWSAVSALHTLFEELEGGLPCVTRLTRDGWSESTAKEISRIATEARKAQRKVVSNV
jgi:hypothetical protein